MTTRYDVDKDELAEISDCCGAEIIRDDLCSECKEHCEPHEWDDDDLTPEEMNAELRQLGF